MNAQESRLVEKAITATTGLVGLFGHPVRHSLSPCIHNAAFRAQGLDYVYLAFDVTPDALPAALKGVRALGIRGVNLTVPHKEAVLDLLDELEPAAAQVEAVNTVVNHAGVLRGHNTDILGFQRALRSVAPGGVKGETCLVFGAGGASRAVVAALLQDEAGCVYICNRTYARAETLARKAEKWSRGANVKAVAFHKAAEALLASRIVINTVPIGLTVSVKESGFPVDTMHGDHVLLDLVYGETSTELVEAARRRGAVAIDGKEMLVGQAAASYKLWTGVEPPIEVMRGSLTSD